MKRSELRRTAWMRRGGRVKARNPKRQAKSFVRAFGSVERVQWLRERPCYVCGAGPCDNAHTGKNATGYRADADTIVPLCRPHHRELHTVGRFTFEATHAVSLTLAASATEQAWQRS